MVGAPVAGSRSEEMAETGMLLERVEEAAAASAWMAAAVKAGREVYRSKARRHERSVREGEAVPLFLFSFISSTFTKTPPVSSQRCK